MINLLKKIYGAKTHVGRRLNVGYQLTAKNGEQKKLFQDNAANRAIFSFFRKLAADKGVKITNEDGTPAEGIIASLALYGLRIPFITGFWTSRMNIANLVVNAGMAGVASRINGAGGEAAFTYIAVGTGAVAPAATDTALGAEIIDSGLARANSTASRVTTDVTNDTAQLVNTFSVTGTKAVTESGVLNAASVGTLLCRQTFSAVNVVNGDSLQVTWKIDVD